MNIWKRILTVNQTALEQYRTLSDQQLYELLAVEKANLEHITGAFPRRRRRNWYSLLPEHREAYLAQNEKILALHAAILERPSAANHPDFHQLVAAQGRGCTVTPAGILLLGLTAIIVIGLILGCVALVAVVAPHRFT